jgi:hypothetical protein
MRGTNDGFCIHLLCCPGQASAPGYPKSSLCEPMNATSPEAMRDASEGRAERFASVADLMGALNEDDHEG